MKLESEACWVAYIISPIINTKGAAYLTYLLTPWSSLSWEANQFSTSQETPPILWNPKVHYRIGKCPPPAPILSQLDPVHTFTTHFLKIHLYTTFPSTPGTPKWSHSLRFPRLSSSPYVLHAMPRPSHSSRFDHPNNMGEENRSFNSSICSFLHSPVTSSLLSPNILLNTLFPNTPSLRSSRNVSDQVSHPYKTQAKL